MRLEYFDRQRIDDRQHVGNRIARRNTERNSSSAGSHEKRIPGRISDRDNPLTHGHSIDADFIAFGSREEKVGAVKILENEACPAPGVHLDVEIKLGRIQNNVAFRDAIEVLLPKRERLERAAERHRVGDVRSALGKRLPDDRARRVFMRDFRCFQLVNPLI